MILDFRRNAGKKENDDRNNAQHIIGRLIATNCNAAAYELFIVAIVVDVYIVVGGGDAVFNVALIFQDQFSEPKFLDPKFKKQIFHVLYPNTNIFQLLSFL